MIFTSCCYCDEPFTVGYEIGDTPVGSATDEQCEKCGKTNIVELTSFDGRTWKKEAFFKEYPKAKKVFR